jgi:hypothetical protein
MKVMLKTRDVKARTGWSMQKIQQLIKSGRLPAINSSTGSRPVYEVREEDLDSLLTPAVAKAEKQSNARRRIDANVPKVFG